ncbi:MAG TPA: urease accessory UreF family protein [Chthoniobacteraceae bacterium]|jgi:urease accessory protein
MGTITREQPTWLSGLLQTSDALFPTGAYAHSFGFEECVRMGIVRDEASLRQFLITTVLPAQRQQELPYLRYAREAAATGDLTELRALDNEISAWKLAEESRLASAQLGQRRLRALCIISAATLLSEVSEAADAGLLAPHHLIVCGVQAAVEQIPLGAALGTYFYQAVAAICAAALKLIRIGQEGVQRVLRTVTLLGAEAVRASLKIEREDAGWFNPLLEIASMRHARADERLFIS